MKRTILIMIGFMVFSLTMIAQKDSIATAKFKWLKTETIDLGKIEQGTPIPATFEFKNVGKSPLLIQSVQKTCGCTDLDYSKQPVEKNEKGFVKVVYNAANIGFFTKTVVVKSNASDPSVILYLKGEVIKK